MEPAVQEPEFVSTGALPAWERVDELVREAHRRFADDRNGVVADYIPVLADVDPELFGLAAIDVDGGLHDAGDALHAFSIQSISKLFVYALAVEEHGHERVREIVGVDNTGLPFNSVMALELHGGHPRNPMVNAGAIATTALIAGATAVEQWELIREGLSAFAGRPLSLDGAVYASEAETNERNRALGRLLRSYGRLGGDPDDVVDVYTRQSRRRGCRGTDPTRSPIRPHASRRSESAQLGDQDRAGTGLDRLEDVRDVARIGEVVARREGLGAVERADASPA